MSLAPGTRLGVHEIISQIGEGGMGQVYRARDTSLARDVAIKILPDAVAADPDRLARFEREARMLAALNHPNIAAIYAVERSAGLHAIVMELVDGDDLSSRISRGALPLEEALPIAKQIADALAAAHDEGIIHRDLKPANIKVRPDGTVKVLDFGLAKALEPAGVTAAPGPYAPTITSPAMMTGVGMILGTAAYMAPEQARGKTVDRRADIWALGAVLFEMLTGKRAFEGEDVAETLASVINKEPDWTRLPATLSPTLVMYLRRCLHKNPRQRIADAQDVRLALDGAFESLRPEMPAVGSSTASREWVAWIAAIGFAILAGALAVPAVRHLRELAPATQPETRVDIVTPVTEQPEDFELSPDGRQVVFVASGGGTRRLWVRSLSSATAQPLAGTEGASAPFWSPDGRAIAFFANARLQRINVNGGTPQTVATITGRVGGGTWNADGVILFGLSPGPLLRVNASGGDVTAVTKLDRDLGHRWPFFLPDGRHFLFAASGSPGTDGIRLGSLDSPEVTRLTTNPADLNVSAGVYLPGSPGTAGASGEGGWLLWVRAGTLVAQRLDVDKRALTGEPVIVANPVAVNVPLGRGGLSASRSGVVAYRTAQAGRKQLQWFDRSGKALGALGAPDENGLATIGVSPDGHRAAVHRNIQNNGDIWLIDNARTSRFTFDAAIEGYALWSPDGQSIVFRSRRKGTWDLYRKSSSGAGAEELLVESPQVKAALSWSAGGRFLLYQSADPQTYNDLWLLSMDKGGQPSVFLKTPFSESWARISPDGRWVAYSSNESGRDEIYVRPFREPGPEAPGRAGGVGDGQWPVSTTGGIHPRWRPDSKEVYYLSPAGDMMGVSMAATGTGVTLGPPVRLFATTIAGGGTETGQGPQYDVSADGRFLIISELDTAIAPITLIQHWHPDGNK